MGEYAGERAGYLGQVERPSEHLAVADLAAGPGAQEAPKLLFAGPVPLGGLPGKGGNGPSSPCASISCSVTRDTERADQLVFQVGYAHEEPELFGMAAAQARTKPGPFQAAAESMLLPLVAQARQPDAEPPRAEQLEEMPDVGRPPIGTTNIPSAFRSRPWRAASVASAA